MCSAGAIRNFFQLFHVVMDHCARKLAPNRCALLKIFKSYTHAVVIRCCCINLKCTHPSLCAVGIATCYGLDGPGIESSWVDISRACSDQPQGPPSLLYNGHQFACLGINDRGVALTTHSNLATRLKKE